MTTLQIVWYILVAVLLIGYSILDGFDLGVGFWQLFAKKEEDRRRFMASIGPFWDGNEVWLLTGGGALFAAFPPVYASVFSGFYLALMLLLFALIFRAVSLEFRNHLQTPRWRKTWDVAFAVGSSLPALLFGVALGNIMRGIPLNENGDYTGTFFGLLNPFALVIGLTGFAMLITHGALWLAMRIKGEAGKKALSWAKAGWVAYLVLFIVSGVFTFAAQGQLLENYNAFPVLWVIPVLALAAIVLARVFMQKEAVLKAFLASAAGIAMQFAIVAAGIFPKFVPALNDPTLSLTAGNSSSSEYTLGAMLIITLIGLPLVLVYTVWVYRTFTGEEVAGYGDH